MTQAPQYPQIPAERTRIEQRVLNSRFIASAAPAATVEAARGFIAELRVEMPDASHHVYAYVIGHGATITLGMSDDGEPSGTAGRPVLAVVRGSGLGDVVVVVTRYFGGTLLGTGGLVRAYSDAAREVVATIPRIEKIERRTLLLVIPYHSYELARRIITAHTANIRDESFASDITLTISIPLTHLAAFQAALVEATAGTVEIEELT